MTSNDIGLRVEILDTLLQILLNEAKMHYPLEFGGILIGYYSEDGKTCHISDSILPKEFESGKYSFKRGTKGLQRELENLYNAIPRRIYVGEWHTHPDGPPSPSETDKQAMKTIANDDNVAIASPILMIIGISNKSHSVGLFVNFKNKLYKYECK